MGVEYVTSRPTSGALQEGFGFGVSIPPLEISAFFQRCHCRALIAGTKKFFVYIVSCPLDEIQIKYKVFPPSPGLRWSFLTSQWLLLLLPAPDRAPENIVELLELRWYASVQRFFPFQLYAITYILQSPPRPPYPQSSYNFNLVTLTLASASPRAFFCFRACSSRE